VKVAVIGGGSTYTPELVVGFMERIGSLPLTELCLMDSNPARLEIVGGFVRRMVAARGDPFRVTLSADLREAVRGARAVCTQLRVGMMGARREDEYLGRRHGLVGQETTGVGGMAKALRTIPAILDVAEAMLAVAESGALMVNFTNPSGLVTEALFRHAPDVPAVGLCNSAVTTKMGILQRLERERGVAIAPERAGLDCLGLNHLTWYRGFSLDGEDLWNQVLEAYLARLRTEARPDFDVRTVETLRMIPNGYLRYYYYTDRMIEGQQAWPPSRAEAVMAIEEELLRQYAEPERVQPPADLMKRGGAYYSTVATQLIDAHFNDLGETHIANVRHCGTVPGVPADWVLEMPCRVDGRGVHPLPAEPLPDACLGLVAQVKMYELLTVEAAVRGDRRAAYEALLANPLGPSADRIGAVLDDMLTTNKSHLPRFWE
jgi:6-phospho-beta-glucosidase